MLREALTENGYVRGIPAADPRITVFKGIPYAKPPVGELRFCAPLPPDSWEGIRECKDFGPIPMQDVPGGNPNEFYAKEWHVDPETPMSEDCLYLNVWTPAKHTEEKLPVLIWIFGGAFQGGYSSEMEFDGERMARRGIIVVSMNYRVNIFGLLAHEELTAENPAGPNTNFGLLDQRAAFLWVQKNIAAFGGDPANVTIGGQSAGAGCVLNHIVSPLTDGLFHKAIMQSGGGLRTKVFLPGKNKQEAQQLGEDFFRFAGIKSLAEARAMDANELFKYYVGFREKHGFVCFQPCVDGYYLPTDPSEAVIQGKHKDIPYMLGQTSGEQFGIPKNLIEFEESIRKRYPQEAEQLLKAANATSVERMQELYRSDALNIRTLANMLFCRTQLMQDRSPTYLYYFAPTMVPGDNAGAFHSSELWFMFETLAKSTRPFYGKHYDLAHNMCNYWTNFIKNGNPNGVKADGSPMVSWKPFTREEAGYICLNEDNIRMEPAESELMRVMYDIYLN
jgi:para-nitrobenzyl esterase